MWDQQDLAERDIPTDPNSGEWAAGARGGGDIHICREINLTESLWSKASERLRE